MYYYFIKHQRYAHFSIAGTWRTHSHRLVIPYMAIVGTLTVHSFFRGQQEKNMKRGTIGLGRYCIALLAVGLTLALVAGAAQAGEKKITVGWINATMSNSFYKVLVDSAQTEAQKYGWTFTYIDSGFDTAKELAGFEDMIAKEVDMILVDCVDPSGVISGVNRAVREGIPVIAVDNGVNPAAKVITTVLSDNKNLGIVGGQWAGKQFDKDVKVKALAMSGQHGNTEAQKRRNGFWTGLMQSRIMAKEGVEVSIDELFERALVLEQELVDRGRFYDERADFEVAMQAFGDFSETGGLRAMEDMLVAHSDANLLISENDPMAQGALRAVKNHGLEGKIMLCAVADGMTSTLKLIKDGDIASCGQNNPRVVGALAIQTAKRILVDGEDPATFPEKILTPAVLMTKENVDQYYDPSSEF